MGILNTTWRHMRRSPYQTGVSITTIVLIFLLISFSALTVLRAQADLAYIESIPQVSAFFKDEAKQEDMGILKQNLEARSDVKSVHFVSKEEALETYKKQNQDDPLLLELVTSDILPASLEISTYQAAQLNELANVLKNSPIVEEVVFPKDVVDDLVISIREARRNGIFQTVILASISILTILTLIAIKVSQRKEEIEIKRLLGASSWYIRWPFIFEGILYGVIGAVVAWTISYGILFIDESFYRVGLYTRLIATASQSLSTPLFMGALLVIELSLGIILGFLGSFLAVLRYLK